MGVFKFLQEKFLKYRIKKKFLTILANWATSLRFGCKISYPALHKIRILNDATPRRSIHP